MPEPARACEPAMPLRLLASWKAWAVVLAIAAVPPLVWHFLSDYRRGTLAARWDGLRGRDQVLAYGYPAPWLAEYERLLAERYGVELNEVAGCVVTERLRQYVRGYNDVVEARTRARHGRDIFAECRAEAEKEWRVAHPDGRWPR